MAYSSRDSVHPLVVVSRTLPHVMGFAALHSWDVSPGEARAIQERLAPRVEGRDRIGAIERVAGLDVGFDRRGRDATARAAVVTLRFPSLEPVERITAQEPVTFPYVPGLLSFREVPVLLKALEELETLPDLLVCDAHGLCHPRRFGLACHLGLITDIPTLGVAKSLLVGEHEEIGEERGSWEPIRDDGETVGAVLRTRTRVRPVYVSVGHRISLETARELTLDLAPRYRLPETTRAADRLASG